MASWKTTLADRMDILDEPGEIVYNTVRRREKPD